jgi:hypothetical protein
MRTWGAAAQFSESTEERRRWLENLAAACERVLIRDAEHATDPHYALLRDDIVELLARIRAELGSAPP